MQGASPATTPTRVVTTPRVTLRAENWRHYWDATGLTNDQARADAMGVPKSSYSVIISGQREPNRTFMARACVALGRTLDDLFRVTCEGTPGDD